VLGQFWDVTQTAELGENQYAKFRSNDRNIEVTQVRPMTEPKKIPEFVETSLAYIVATVAAWLGFLLGWFVCAVASR
jgi:hypothetical protein